MPVLLFRPASSEALPVGSAPSMTIEIGFMTTPTYGDGFVLDSPTQGVLDGTTYTLGGPDWSDITNYVSSLQIARGRQRQLDQWDAGTCDLVLRNESRLFDPTFTSGTYFGGIMLRCPIRVKVRGIDAYYGYIEDYALEYDGPRVATVGVTASDALSRLAQCKFAARTPSAEKSGARVEWALSRTEVRFPADQIGRINAGSSTLGAYAIDAGTNVLDYLNEVAIAERGKLYAQKDGTLRFRGRMNVPTATSVTFSDTGVGIPYQQIAIEFGAEAFYNHVSVTREGGTEQIAFNEASILAYGVRGLNYDGMLLSSDAQAKSMATALLGQYLEPELRVASLSVNLNRLTTAQQDDVLNLDIGKTVAIVRTPPGGGAAIQVTGVIEGVSHERSVDRHDVTLQLSSTTGVALVLGDSTFGLLGTNTLGY